MYSAFPSNASRNCWGVRPSLSSGFASSLTAKSLQISAADFAVTLTRGSLTGSAYHVDRALHLDHPAGLDLGHALAVDLQDRPLQLGEAAGLEFRRALALHLDRGSLHFRRARALELEHRALDGDPAHI